MKILKKACVLALAATLCLPNTPAWTREIKTVKPVITFDTGSVKKELSSELGENKEYTIKLEKNAFFPYEVQFKYDGKVVNEWFMSPDDYKIVGGHKFNVESENDGTSVTQMKLEISGKEVIVYPASKKFEEKSDKVKAQSLMYLTERNFSADLSDFTPVELTNISLKKIFSSGNTELSENVAVLKSYGKSEVVKSTGALDVNDDYSLEIIVGKMDQLDTSNIRNIIHINKKYSNYGDKSWLLPTVYGTDGKKSTMRASYVSSYNERFDIQAEYKKTDKSYKIGFKLNSKEFPNPNFTKLKFFEGAYKNAKSAEKGKEITSKIWNKAEYEITEKNRYVNPITIVSYDATGKATGCLSYNLYFYTQNDSVDYNLFKSDKEREIYGRVKYEFNNDVIKMTYEADKKYPEADNYYLGINYRKAGMLESEDYKNNITAVFAGKYNSIGEAKKAGKKDIKEELKANSYKVKFGATYTFTAFVGEDKDKNQLKLHHILKLKNGKSTEGKRMLDASSEADCSFWLPLNTEAENEQIERGYEIGKDSYAEGNFVTFYVNEKVDLSKLALSFELADKDGAKLYAAGSNSPEVSGKSFHDFSKGAVQFTAVAADGKNAKSYWVRIIKNEQGGDKLFVNSLSDPNIKVTKKGDVTYLDREALFDSYHGYRHDINLANYGTEAIKNISVRLSSSDLELDPYWTLTGNSNLEAMSDKVMVNNTDYNFYESKSGESLQPQARIRLLPKNSIEKGSTVKGKLTIKSGNKELMVLNITGLVGDPVITTKKVPKAVKFVPYGSVIQNSNKYSWNQVTYKLKKGKLPEGMKLKPNGEIYGVPKKKGKYTFTVLMDNSYEKFKNSTKKYAFTVLDNSDKNVEKATDKGYKLSTRLDNIGEKDNYKTYLMVSEGVFPNFVDLYLDGEKLVRDTDYEAESGSTRLTIKAQTLKKRKKGKHTIGIEFREKDTDKLKKSAQNYELVSGKKSKSNKPIKPVQPTKPVKPVQPTKPIKPVQPTKPVKPVQPTKPVKPVQPTKPVKPVQPTKPIQPVNPDMKEYVIKAGDTLWAIAEMVYGNGREWIKIMAANEGIIPEKLRIGQKIILP